MRVMAWAWAGWVDGLILHSLAPTQTRTPCHIFICDIFVFRHFNFRRYSGDSFSGQSFRLSKISSSSDYSHTLADTTISEGI